VRSSALTTTSVSETPNVAVVGEALVDVLAATDGGDAHAMPGGSPANVAVALARLGLPPRLFTSFAGDRYGTMLQHWLTESGVDAVVSEPPSARTSTATVTLNDAGVASYEFDLDWALDHRAIYAAYTWAQVLHTGSIATVLPPGCETVEACLRAAQGNALITFDPNARPGITPDRAQTVAAIERLVALADVVKVSAEDLAWYYPDVDPEAAAASWLGTSASPLLVVVTKGPDGAVALRRATRSDGCPNYSNGGQVELGGATIQRVQIPGERINLADTIGAGDTYMGALIAALIEQGIFGPATHARLAALENEKLSQILHWANTAAAINCSRKGANPPTRNEIDNHYQSEPASSRV